MERLFALSLYFCVFSSLSTSLWAREYHVSPSGDDAKNDGTREKPFKTITQGAYDAHPGDTVIVHEGVYRERVDPFRSGESDARRIVYEAAPGENVEIRGSDVIKGWKKMDGGGANAWEVTVNNSRFGTVNPYAEFVWGDYISKNTAPKSRGPQG
jgi:alpha-N-arabinofuranosidase